MIQRKMHSIVTSVLSLAVISAFVCFPVYADRVANVSIIEKVADGSGGYKPWEDIIGAMPGERYSVIPQVKNNGSVDVGVLMCLSGSVASTSGAVAELSTEVFEINIGEHWSLDSESDSLGLGLVSCYKYDSALEANGMTEPIFTEVALSSKLGNMYKNSVFNLYLQAFTVGNIPDEPDTGVLTMQELFSRPNIILSWLGVAALIVLAIHFVTALRQRSRENYKKR